MKKTNKQITNKSVKESSSASIIKKRRAWLFPIKEELVLFAGLALFLLTALFIVGDYGMNIDSQKNFREGEMNLNYLLTGQVDQRILQWQMHGAMILMAAEISKRLLHDTIHLYDPVAAHLIILPFLTAAFLFFLFHFVKKRWSPLHGLIAVGLLLTFPYFWGEVFNNQKDLPLLIFFSLALMSFVEWEDKQQIRYLYGFFILWGIALAIKTYALFVLLLLIVWILIRPTNRASKENRPGRSLILHVIAGFSIVVVIFLIFYAPAFWGIEGKWSFLQSWHGRLREITWGGRTPFNVNSFVQVFFRTPLFVLVFALLGFFKVVKDYRTSSLYALLLLWLFLPLLVPCFPHTLKYHCGMRHYFVALVPFAILAMVGLGQFAVFFAEKLKTDRKVFLGAMASFTIGISLWGVVETHPYQTTFFNAFAGGLKGAQEKQIYDSSDYWMISYKEAGRWICDYGVPRANVFAVYSSGPPVSFYNALIENAIDRPDLKLFRIPTIPVRNGGIDIPGNSYVILVPHNYLLKGRLLLELSGQFEKVYVIRRQGGEISTIYYKPWPTFPAAQKK
jgi:hypothetical protein